MIPSTAPVVWFRGPAAMYHELIARAGDQQSHINKK
jgi:hypothetical protein